jgi:hypothetical protein
LLSSQSELCLVVCPSKNDSRVFTYVVIIFFQAQNRKRFSSLNSSVAIRRRLRQQGSSDVVLSPLNPVHDLLVKQTERTKRKRKKNKERKRKTQQDR